MKPVITWILVADGARARVLENDGPGKGLREITEFAQAHLRARDIMADRPGRSFDTTGKGRSSMEPPTDPVEKREADFAKGLADTLESHRRRGDFDRLILVAAPSALGDLRAALDPHLKDAVYAELDKDLTRVPNAEMPKHLAGILVV